MVAVPDRFVGVRGASSAADRRRAKEIGVTRALQHEVSVLQSEVKLLHSVLSQRLGLNSRGIKDAFGKEFAVSVDEEHKATTLRIFNFTNPHGRAFHTSWFGFFSTFFTMFTAAPLMSEIRKPSSLNLSNGDIVQADICAVSTNIISRIVTGYVCDMIGPRRTLAILCLIICPPALGMLWVNSAAGFIVCRGAIGLGLASFVTSQVWCTQMHSKSVVGLANATSAGWGNMGGGVTNLVMPFVFSAIYNLLDGTPLEKEDRAWRYCYLLPVALCLVSGGAALTGRDLPDGDIKDLEKTGAKQKAHGRIVLRTGVCNVNAWLLTITYGMCFGVELTLNAVAFLYFHDYHGLEPHRAGLYASLYGLMNIFARSLGGQISDWSNERFGMRGRVWACWIVMTLEGVFCMLMASVTLSFDAPFNRKTTMGWTQIDALTCARFHEDNSSRYYHHKRDLTYCPVNDTQVSECGCVHQALSEEYRNRYEVGDELRMICEPAWGRDGDAMNCIQHQENAVGLAVFCLICFSICVQAAEGLHYGIVPYVSRPALGVVSGMVSAGGPLGAVVLLSSFFEGGNLRLDEGFLRLGMVVCGLTTLIVFIYFPEHGSMLLRPRALGTRYDPQLIKPPPDYRGSDSVRMFVLGQVLVMGQ